MRLTVNGRNHDVDAAPDTALLYVLRNDLALNGPKYGCGLGECGACAVLIDGVAARACVIPIEGCAGRDIVTLEGLGSREHPDPVQEAFIREQAAQCGYCTPGQICAAVGVLDELRRGVPSHVSADLNAVTFSDLEVRERLSGNICRCAAYPNIIEAVREVYEATGR